MYTLENNTLAVSILDPVADQSRFGVRYCTGGYIFQVADARLGPLLSGPTYPDSFNWFDGQGMPDAFNLSPLRPITSTTPEALILGIGVCDLETNEVKSFCQWNISEAKNAITMQTSHSFEGYEVEIERTVSLLGRTVRSMTEVRNRGRLPVPLRWFPHPFYPQPVTDELIKLTLPVGPIEHEAYAMADNGFIMRKGWPWQTGHYLPLQTTSVSGFTILQKHPLLGMVAAIGSYAPAFFPIWGNPNTFSWEPFLERTVGPYGAYRWWIDYDF